MPTQFINRVLALAADFGLLQPENKPSHADDTKITKDLSLDLLREVITKAAKSILGLYGPRPRKTHPMAFRPPLKQIPQSAFKTWQLESNERHLDLFFPYLHRPDGIFVGPATDASLTLLAQSASALALFCDISPWAIFKMILTRALVKGSTTRHDFVAQYTRYRSQGISRDYFSKTDAKFMEETVLSRALLPSPGYYAHQLTDGISWLSSDTSYQHIRDLFLHAGITLTLGSLTDDLTWKQIVRTTQKTKTPVDYLYMSNIPFNDVKEPDSFNRLVQAALAPDARLLRTTVGKASANTDAWDYHVVDFRFLSPFLESLGSENCIPRYLSFLRANLFMDEPKPTQKLVVQLAEPEIYVDPMLAHATGTPNTLNPASSHLMQPPIPVAHYYR